MALTDEFKESIRQLGVDREEGDSEGRVFSRQNSRAGFSSSRSTPVVLHAASPQEYEINPK